MDYQAAVLQLKEDLRLRTEPLGVNFLKNAAALPEKWFFLITTYSVLFHFLMEYEGRRFTWITGLYWTLTVMSTLGFGDFTFTSDLGQVFSVIVFLSGVLMLLITLPFTFITFFYAPWLEAGDYYPDPYCH